MASSIIHMAVANEINKKLKRNQKNILIGSIAPDISKQIGESKKSSHFLTDDTDIPDLNKFLCKYKRDLDDDFVLGYYIHLYTDYIWFKYFIADFIKEDYIFDINGNKLKLDEKEKLNYIYNDYTNLNIQIIDKYNLDLSIFYEIHDQFKNIIKEIPMDKIQIIIDKAGIIIENSKQSKPYIFNINHIDKFINLSTNIILDELTNLRIY